MGSPDRRAARLAVPATVVVLLAGCSGPVKVPVPQPDSKIRKLCVRLHGKLPSQLADRQQRPTRPQSRLVAAWGDPPIALRCGVGRPPALRPTSRLAVVNGVEWLPVPARSPRRFVTVSRTVYVQVIVPEDMNQPPGNALVDLAAPIKATIPRRS